MTIGDVLAVASATALVVFSWIALLVTATVLMTARVAAARDRIETSPGLCALRGAIVAVIGIILTASTMHSLVGPARLLPLLLWGAILAATVVGSGGIVQIIASRTADFGAPRITQIFRAASLYAAAGLFPICGWMIVTPIAFVLSLGAVVARSPRRAPDADPSRAVRPSELAAERI